MRTLLLLLAACADKTVPPGDSAAPTDDCPRASTDAVSLTWADVPVGESATESFALANACGGETALEVTATLVGSGSFSLAAEAWSIDPGGIETIEVAWAPQGFEEDTGVLTLATNDPSLPQIALTLTGTALDDADGDGSPSAEDCDDADPDSHPGAQETWYDGVDQACDGGSDYDRDGDGADADGYGGDDCDDSDAAVHPGATETWYDGVDGDCAGDDDHDADADGYSAESGGGEDCDDDDATVHPGAADTAYDGVDADCSGSDYDADGDGHDATAYGGDDCDDADAAISPSAAETWYDGTDGDCAGDGDYDADADGYDHIDHGGADCDDAAATTYPGASDAWYDGVDADCAGDSDYDADLDGYEDATYGGTDCDDADAALHPGATDTAYDGVDTDCDGASDYDADGDGEDADTFGGSDCDDADATIGRTAAETWYDGVDSDCNGGSDYDQDGDGEDRFADGGADCDDTDASTLEGPEETRNGEDDNCDGAVDEGLVEPGDVLITEVMANPDAVSDTVGEWFEVQNVSTWDVDMAGWIVYSDDGSEITIEDSIPLGPGDIAVLGVEDDTTRNGGVTLAYAYARVDFAFSDLGDSVYLVAGDETIAELSFDATWAVDGEAVQLDPDHLVAADATDEAWWCAATEAFGSGDLGSPGEANEECDLDEDGDGWSPPDGDCDDEDAGAYPGATESADGVDNDCDDVVDEGTADDDGDGWSEVAGDCDDADATVSPGEVESCNGVDDDCDGATDPSGSSGCTTYYYDYDGDGYGSESIGSVCTCSASGYYSATVAEDCYDYNSSASPVTTSYWSTSRGDGSYDYDCDGTETRRYTSSGSCGSWPTCSATTGWASSTPSCGSSGAWVSSCSLDWFTCDENTTTVTQTCR